ncbi:MAG TPA: phosphotransferase [Candidatus Ozemobacteraceae bacterium]
MNSSVAFVRSPDFTELLENALIPFIRTKRWFAGKAKAISSARLLLTESIDIVPIRKWICAICEFQFADGTSQKYFLPLIVSDKPIENTCERPAEAYIATLNAGTCRYHILDALQNDGFCRDLILFAKSAGSIGIRGGRLNFTPGRLLQEHSLDLEVPVLRPKVEQSNSSFFLGNVLAVKIYRQIQNDVNPELDIGRFLTELAAFPHIARVAGAIEFVGDDGSNTTLAILQEFVPNRGDGWNHTLAILDHLCDSREIRTDDDPGDFTCRMERLGLRIGTLHSVLSSTTCDPAFEPERITREDWSDWRNAIGQSLGKTISDLDQYADSLPDSLRTLVGDVSAAAPTVRAWLDGFEPNLVSIRKSRIHGDLHLGQVLVTDDDFVIIDFEGEPSRPVRERRRKQLPMRDVAGMMRSFSYAACMAGKKKSKGDTAFDYGLADGLKTWETRVTSRFLTGYRRGAAGCISVPQDRELFDGLLNLFLLEKVLYECAYEMNNRPGWIDIPLLGLWNIVGNILGHR